ncbi:MAG: PEGA domain-containing protein [Deltaproteobacteria bacterium]|nr:PEGA domain-containing protein [Deltaproteobacteria bacterium]
MGWIRPVLAVLAVIASLVAAAHAQPGAGAEQPDSAGRDEAAEHFESGVALMRNENWDAAILEFRRSLELFPTRSATFNLGMCLMAVHRYREALAQFDAWEVQWGAVATAEQHAAVDEAVADLRGFLALLVVTVDVAGAEIRVDGRTVGQSPLARPVTVEVGTHVVEVSAQGCAPARQEVSAVSGERVVVTVSLETSPVAGAPVVEPPPVEPPPVEPSPVEPPPPVEAAAVEPPPVEPPSAELDGADGISQIWFWIVAGTAVAAAGAGTATAVLTMETASDDDAETYALLTNVLLPAAGACAAAAVFLAIFTDFAGESPPAAVGAFTDGDAVGITGWLAW